MFWRKKKHPVEIEVKHVSLPTLIRQSVYDAMLEPAEEIAVAMGLPPISDEVAEMEERASQRRLERIAQLLPFLESHSEIAAKIAVHAYLLQDNKKLEIDEEEKDNLLGLFRIVALSASISSLSSLVDLELLDSRVEYDDGE